MLGLAQVRDSDARRDRRAAVGALLEGGGARGAGEEVVARLEDDGPRRVGLHADRAEEAVLERLVLELDLCRETAADTRIVNANYAPWYQQRILDLTSGVKQLKC